MPFNNGFNWPLYPQKYLSIKSCFCGFKKVAQLRSTNQEWVQFKSRHVKNRSVQKSLRKNDRKWLLTTNKSTCSFKNELEVSSHSLSLRYDFWTDLFFTGLDLNCTPSWSVDHKSAISFLWLRRAEVPLKARD